MTIGDSGFVLIQRFGQFVAELLLQQWRSKHFDLCAKTQDVTQQFAFIGIDSEGDLLFDYEIPIPNQVLYAVSGTDVNRTAASGTITYAPTCTWIDANDIATWLYLTPATAGDLAFLTSCAAAANATCYRKRQEAGYAADSLTTPPSADVELATTILGGTLYRSRSSMDQIASYDGMGVSATVGITSQIKILLGIPRAQVA
jgi:hypothetical protein